MDALCALTNRACAAIALNSSLLAATCVRRHRLPESDRRKHRQQSLPGGQLFNVSRRQFVAAVPAVFGGASILSACSPASDPEDYEAVAASTWRTGPLAGVEGAALTRELVHCGTLAPSSHNTQCWRFAQQGSGLTILPDLSM